MSTKRTIINADEELVIKGKLTIEGNVTQIETTQQVTNLQGNVFTINSDSSNTSAILALNSNGTVASFTFDSANGSVVINRPVNFGTSNITAPNFIGNVIGNVTGYVSSIANHTTSGLTEGTNLYYTVARANAAIDARLPNTDALVEGSANLYYTVARANSAINAYLSGGDGVDYANGIIAVDSTVVRTTGTQTITGNTTFVGTTSINGNIVPTTANTGFIGTPAVHIGEVWANLVHAERLDLGDADLSDIHATFYAGTPTGNIVSADTSTAGGLIYNHKQAGQANAGGYYRVNAGAGLEIDGNGILKIDSTVITTAGGTINGNLTINGQLNYQNVVDSYVTDTIITLNANAIVNNDISIVAHRPTATDVEIRWNESESRWQFTNDGNTYVNIVEISDLDGGAGLVLNGNGLLAVGAGDGITVDADNVSVNSTVVRTTGNQSLANTKTFTGELVIPSSTATSNGAIFYDSANSQAFIRINDTNLEITPASLVGDVEDVGSAGINLYAGSREVPGSSATVTQSLIAAKVGLAANIVVDGNITGFTSIFDTTSIISGNTFVTPANVSFAELSVMLEQQGYLNGQRITLQVYKNGSLIYQQVDDRDDVNYGDTYFTTGPIQTTSGDIFNFAVSGLDTQDQAGGKGIQTTYTYLSYKALLSTPSVEASKIHGIKSIDDGTYTTLTEASNVITVDANITAIRGAFSTSNIAGYGNLSYNSSNGVFSYSGVTDSQIRTLFSGSGLITYNSANGSITTSADNYSSWTVQTDSGVGAAKTISSAEKLTIQGGTNITVTNVGNVITIVNDNVADIESVSAGDGLTGGGNSGNVTLNIGAGPGITVNTDDIAIDAAYIRSLITVSDNGGDGSLSYSNTTGVISYAGPSAAELLSHFTGGDGIDISSISSSIIDTANYAPSYSSGYSGSGWSSGSTYYSPYPTPPEKLNLASNVPVLLDLTTVNNETSNIRSNANTITVSNVQVNKADITANIVINATVDSPNYNVHYIEANLLLNGNVIHSQRISPFNHGSFAENIWAYEDHNPGSMYILKLQAVGVSVNQNDTIQVQVNKVQGGASIGSYYQAVIREYAKVSAGFVTTSVDVTLYNGDIDISVDDTVVRTTGNQNISGTKTFTGSLNINNSYSLPTVDGTNGQKLTTYGNGIVYWSTESADITEVTAGGGLTGGGTSGAVTLNIGAGDGITVNADNIALTSGIITTGAKTYGTASAVPAITVDTYGRVTAISNTSISITASQVSDFTSAANTAIDNRIVGGNGLTYSSGTLAVGAGSYITVAADSVAVDATTTATSSKVVARDGAGNVYANYFVGTATAAQYADLAENYLADADYLPGTVLVFGGAAEVTACISFESTRVAGVVTTQPAHVMNSDLDGPHVACIALRGRVPVKVMGVVRKGDVLVSAGEGHVGYAVAALYPRDVPASSIVGKAIGDKLDVGLGVVEALI